MRSSLFLPNCRGLRKAEKQTECSGSALLHCGFLPLALGLASEHRGRLFHTGLQIFEHGDHISCPHIGLPPSACFLCPLRLQVFRKTKPSAFDHSFYDFLSYPLAIWWPLSGCTVTYSCPHACDLSRDVCDFYLPVPFTFGLVFLSSICDVP